MFNELVAQVRQLVNSDRAVRGSRPVSPYPAMVQVLETRQLLSATGAATVTGAAAATPLTPPALNTEQGAIVAMLLAETTPPSFASYTAASAQTSMKAQRATITNRIHWDQTHSSAPLFFRPSNAFDVLGRTDQFPEFVRTSTGIDYSTSTVGVNVKNRINDFYAIANNPADSRSAAFRAHIELAQQIAATDGSSDPYKDEGGTYFFNTGFKPSPKAEKIPDNPGLPGKIMGVQFWTLKGGDLSLIIDSTGSMADDIDSVKTNATTLVQKLFESSPNSRISVVTYKDPGETTVNLRFTGDVDTAVSAINAISVGGGGDTPEGVYSGMLTSLQSDGAAIGTWHADPINRSVIVMGDAPAKDSSLQGQVAALLADNTIDADILLSPSVGTVAAAAPITLGTTIPLSADPYQLFTIAIGGDTTAQVDFATIAGLVSGGRALTAANATEVVDVLLDAIIDATTSLEAEFAPVPLITTSAVGVVTLNFTEDVTGVNLADLKLTRDGVNIPLAGVTVTQVSARQYTLNLTNLTKLGGDYLLTLVAAGSGITNTAGESLTTDATLSWTNQQLKSFVVQNGEKQRSFVRNLDVTFASTNGLADLAGNGQIKLTQYDLNGLNPVAAAIGTVAVSNKTLKFDFGAEGVGGSRNNKAFDGYYRLSIDADGDGNFETTRAFYRLLGDFNGDREVDLKDTALLAKNVGSRIAIYDLNSDGSVSVRDLTALAGLLRRKLKSSLVING